MPKAILVGVNLNDDPDFEHSMEELERIYDLICSMGGDRG